MDKNLGSVMANPNFRTFIFIGLALLGMILLFDGYSSNDGEVQDKIQKALNEAPANFGHVFNKYPPVLMLHGAAFSSKTWEDLGTLEILKQNQIDVIAIDLPGFGQNKNSPPSNKVTYIDSYFPSSNFVLVSPSMSGAYALPFLFEKSERLAGYVPVAPVGTERYPDEKFERLNVPTLVIYGELDRGLGTKSAKKLEKIPNSETLVIPNGKHPCYLDDPDLFHKKLIAFVQSLPHKLY